MPNILIVDDSAVDRQLAAGLLARMSDTHIAFACNGKEALKQIAADPPDLVLTDLQMPELDGLALVRAIGVHHPDIPVILMTAHGSESLAVTALEQGAASYVSKKQLADRLCETASQTLDLLRSDRGRDQLIRCMKKTELEFVLQNEPELIGPLVELAQQIAVGMGVCEMAEQFQVGSALQEALRNAMYRGNLEISAEQMQTIREQQAQGQTDTLDGQRRREEPYCHRRIHVAISIVPEEAKFVIRDEGPGFDISVVDSASMAPSNGRGLVLMRSCMDRVKYSEQGNQVTLVKYREGVGNTAAKTEFDVVD